MKEWALCLLGKMSETRTISLRSHCSCTRVLYSLEGQYYVDPRQEHLSNRIVFICLVVAILGTFHHSLSLGKSGALEDSPSECPHAQPRGLLKCGTNE